jgi:hypothetical protein
MTKRALEHAKRNHDLAKKLHEEGEYFDWVVTTAFYSAIHYVEHYMFPAKWNNISVNNIEELKDACNTTSESYVGRHQARAKLVRRDLPFLKATYYAWLDDQSRNARYKTYKVKKDFAQKAIDQLEKLLSALEESKNKNN